MNNKIEKGKGDKLAGFSYMFEQDYSDKWIHEFVNQAINNKKVGRLGSEKNRSKHPLIQKKSKKKKITIISILSAAIILVCILIGIFMHYTNLLNRNKDNKLNYGQVPVNSRDLVDKPDTFNQKAREKELKMQLGSYSQKISDENVMNILLIGEDIRDTENQDRGNTDVMMIISINQEKKTITMTSLMRDMLIYMSSFDESGKLNSAYWHGGSEYLQRVVEDYFNVEIDRYVKVNFYQFINVVESVGGLDLMVKPNEADAMKLPLNEQNKYLKNPKKTDYITEDIPEKGKKIHMNGNQALAYARIRYNCGDDYGRTQRQRTVIREVIKNAKNLNLVKLDKLANEIFPEIQTDITNGEIAGLLLNAFEYMDYDIQELRLPVDGYYTDEIINQQQVLSPDYAALAAVFEDVVYGNAKNAEEAVENYIASNDQ